MAIAEQIAHAVIFYFGQVFVYCRLTNKNMLEWFLPIMCKEHTPSRSTKLQSSFPKNELSIFISCWANSLVDNLTYKCHVHDQ